MPVAPLSPFLLDLLAEGWDPPWREPAADAPPRQVPPAVPRPAILPTPGSSR